MNDAQLLSLALGVRPDRAASALARAGGLVGLWHSHGDLELPNRARARLDAFLELGARAMRVPLPSERVEGASDVAARFHARLALAAAESFWVVLLDAHGRVLGEHCVAQGTLTTCVVHPREVFAHAIRRRASHVVLVHNHPSGDPTPSSEDLSLTERLSEAGALLGIPVVDHLVVARTGFRSVGLPQRGAHPTLSARRL